MIILYSEKKQQHFLTLFILLPATKFKGGILFTMTKDHFQELVQFSIFEIIKVPFFGCRVFFPFSLIGYNFTTPKYFVYDSGCLYAMLQK